MFVLRKDVTFGRFCLEDFLPRILVWKLGTLPNVRKSIRKIFRCQFYKWRKANFGFTIECGFTIVCGFITDDAYVSSIVTEHRLTKKRILCNY